MKPKIIGWQWHYLHFMQIICISLKTDNHANTSSLSFYWPDAVSETQPTVLKHRSQQKLSPNMEDTIVGSDVVVEILIVSCSLKVILWTCIDSQPTALFGPLERGHYLYL